MSQLISTLSNLDPNWAFLGIMASLFAVVTIIYTPGTIVGEILSAIFAIITLIGLSQLPTNWLAVLLIVMGVSGFLALPFMSLRWANVADVGLILAVIGGFFLFHDGLRVSPLIIFATVLTAFVYHRLVLLPVLRRHQLLAKTTDENVLIGAIGRVVRPIQPVGTIYLNGENWSARSDEVLPAGTEVIVTAKNGLELRVEKAKRDETLV